MTLGARIAALRKERGLSQEGLGELVGVSRQAVSKWESDSALPDVNNCVALSRAFGITLSQLLELEEEPSAPAGELTEEQLAMVQAIAEKYLSSLPRPRSWRQRRKWPWVLAASVLLVLGVVAAEWVRDLNRTVSYMTGEMTNVHNTVSQAVEEQVNAALTQVTSLVKEKSWTLEEVNLEENTVTFALSAQLRRRTPETPVVFTARSGGETVTAEGTDEGGQRFSARLTCPLSDDIRFFISFQTEGEAYTEELGQSSQLQRSYEMRPYSYVLYSQPYLDKYLEEGRLPQGTRVPLSISLELGSQEALAGEAVQVEEAAVGLFVNGRAAEWTELDLSGAVTPRPGLEESWTRWDWEEEFSLDGPALENGDELTLALYARDNYGRVVTLLLWQGVISDGEMDRGKLGETAWWEDWPYQPAEVGP
ncbi:XRE family transcriptional regulator [Pseudoflavonifractor sp. AF19-9AC]|uniref:helix-turn-helix transcriptional regulator n=1 Tax=Pseudoflavonifractor sp. AF19-9AC TaxID=2292244 RepID=UPI000E47BC28|nr:helix-turn-helix transcriptional regulator [Pseudoflavonifractor sp. AF19-9AC]RHR10912.1 XRE family transcriptional regulator [Pseudoflavonifractor sp. AF19-9AC]